MIQVWIEHGVTLFRVDNPHTKPLEFWEWLIAKVGAEHPEVIFLAEAFTRPAMMHTLAKIGFHQSYTYFTWRNTKEELTEYLAELSGESADYMRPSFWPTTHDILTPYMQYGGAAGVRGCARCWRPRWCPTCGIYSRLRAGRERRPAGRRGADRQREVRVQAARLGRGLRRRLEPRAVLTRLNEIRRAHPALQRLRNLTVPPDRRRRHICFSKRLSAAQSPPGARTPIIVVANLDPHGVRETHRRTSTCRRWALDGRRRLRAPTTCVTGADLALGRARLRATSTRTTEPVHIVHVRGALTVEGLNLTGPGSAPRPHWHSKAVFYEVLVRALLGLRRIRLGRLHAA